VTQGTARRLVRHERPHSLASASQSWLIRRHLPDGDSSVGIRLFHSVIRTEVPRLSLLSAVRERAQAERSKRLPSRTSVPANLPHGHVLHETGRALQGVLSRTTEPATDNDAGYGVPSQTLNRCIIALHNVRLEPEVFPTIPPSTPDQPQAHGQPGGQSGVASLHGRSARSPARPPPGRGRRRRTPRGSVPS
jgi:hypothetical protein